MRQIWIALVVLAAVLAGLIAPGLGIWANANGSVTWIWVAAACGVVGSASMLLAIYLKPRLK